ALFTLVGIAGEDDLDAPDLSPLHPQAVETTSETTSLNSLKNVGGARKSGRRQQPEHYNGRIPTIELTTAESASLLERLVGDVQGLKSPEAALAWACQAMGAKNSLNSTDAQRLDDVFRAKIADFEIANPDKTASAPMVKRDPLDPSRLSERLSST